MWSGDRQLAAPALATPDLAFPLLPHALLQPTPKHSEPELSCREAAPVPRTGRQSTRRAGGHPTAHQLSPLLPSPPRSHFASCPGRESVPITTVPGRPELLSPDQADLGRL